MVGYVYVLIDTSNSRIMYVLNRWVGYVYVLIDTSNTVMMFSYRDLVGYVYVLIDTSNKRYAVVPVPAVVLIDTSN